MDTQFVYIIFGGGRDAVCPFFHRVIDYMCFSVYRNHRNVFLLRLITNATKFQAKMLKLLHI